MKIKLRHRNTVSTAHLPVVGELAVELVGVGAERGAHAALCGDVHHQTQVLLHQRCKKQIGRQKSVKMTSGKTLSGVKHRNENITHRRRSLRYSLCWRAR